MKISNRLEGKIAIVTGTGAGIGQGIGLMFARHGAKVIGCDIDAQAAARTLATAQAEGLDFSSLHPCDLTTPEGAQALAAYAIAQGGRIDILVNAAAFGIFNFIQDMSFDDWKRTLAGELDLVFLLTKAVWPHLIAAGGGSIINFASANAYQALAGSGALAHCAGKGGVLALTRQLAMEGGPYWIRAKSISPGLIVTAATAPVVADPGFRDNVLAKTMIKRLGQPADVAWLATFLASDESSWITGSDHHIDGGATAW